MDELLTRARQGDFEALAQVLHEPRLISTVRTVLRSFCVDAGTMEDVVQELFVRMARLVAENRFPEAATEPRFLGWVATTVRNLAIDATRRQPDLGRVFAELERVRDRNGRADHVGEDLARLQEALARLDEQDRRLIVARYLDGQSFEDIAKWLGTHRHDASVLVKGARDRLARELEKLTSPESVRPPIPLSPPPREPPPGERADEGRRVVTEGEA